MFATSTVCAFGCLKPLVVDSRDAKILRHMLSWGSSWQAFVEVIAHRTSCGTSLLSTLSLAAVLLSYGPGFTTCVVSPLFSASLTVPFFLAVYAYVCLPSFTAYA
jgi:hypothetical protein